MSETIKLGDIAIAMTRKDIKHVHLSVHPPVGRVTFVAPTGTRLEVARAYAISKIGWIREQQRETSKSSTRDSAPVYRAGKPLPLGSALSDVRRCRRCKAVRAAQSPQDHSRGTPGKHPREAGCRSCRSGTNRYCMKWCPR